MTGDTVVVLEMTRLEAAHLTGLLDQFVDLLEEAAGSPPDSGAPPADPALARLVPDAYADDAEASREFRGMTERDLLDRRLSDATTMRATLAVDGRQLDPARLRGDVTAVMAVTLDAEGTQVWLRTLAALRLVLASRLGIRSEADHVEDDPRFGIYDWLGYRLDGLVRAVEAT